MNPGLVVKLRPSGPWRIGPDSGARNRVDHIYHSDSLYSAVTSAMSRMGRLEEWLDATARSATPAVCFGSCFPFIDEIGFITPPRTVWPPAAPSVKAARVRWKSARLVPLTMVQAILAGEPLDENRWTIDGASGCLLPTGRLGPFRTSVRWSAAVDRLSGASERHSTACIEFRSGAGLWTVASFADEAARDHWQDAIKAAFRLLADSGFGGERSRGWGRAHAPEFIEGELPEMIIGRWGTGDGRWGAKPPASEGESRVSEAEGPEISPQKPEAGDQQGGGREPGAGGQRAEAPASEEEPRVGEAEAPEISSQEPEVEGRGPGAGGQGAEAPTSEEKPSTGEAEVPEISGQETEAGDQGTETPASEEELRVAEAEVPEISGPEPEAGDQQSGGQGAEAPASEEELRVAEAEALEISGQQETEAGDSEEELRVGEAELRTQRELMPMVGTGGPPAEEPEEPSPAEEAEAQTEPEPTPEPEAPAPGSWPPAPAVPPAEEPEEPSPAKPIEEPEASTEFEPTPEAVPSPIPHPPSPGPARKGRAHWMLSLFTPAATDTVDWGRGSYTLLARGGRVDSPAGSGELKKQIQMVAEGSVLIAETAPRGAAADVAPDGFAHPVFRSGFALAIPLPEGN